MTLDEFAGRKRVALETDALLRVLRGTEAHRLAEAVRAHVIPLAAAGR